jgi:hypothetical protein
MKTLADILRDADPLAHEPRRSTQERLAKRQMFLDASPPAEAHHERVRLATLSALAIVAIALTAFYWSRTAVDLVAAVRFEVRLAEDAPGLGVREAVIAGTARKIYLHPEPVVVNSDITEAHIVEGENGTTFGVAIAFGAQAAAKMRRATESHIGRPVAILIDGRVVAAPVLRSPISTAALISGNFARAEAERIVAGILGR